MLKLSEVIDKLKEEFKSDIGYEHNSRFSDPNSPYYGQSGWITSTDDSTNCVLHCTNEAWYIDFDFRNVSDDYAVKWCKDFLQKHNVKFTKVEPVYNSEKGWFSVYAYVSKKSICEKYGLYDKYVEAISSDATETYNKLIETIEDLYPINKDITDINDVTDMSKGFGSYFRFGTESDHVSIRIGGKDSGYGLTIFSVVYIKEDGNTILKSDYTWSNDYKEHIRNIKTNLRSHDDLDVVSDLYDKLY